jgi:malate/lactate dehydrogenase
MKVRNIAIIGFGEVGSTLGAILNSNYQNITFNLFDFEEEISGRILDFNHACAVNNNRSIINDKKAIEEADFIIYTAGYSNKVGESRYSVAQKNKTLIAEIFDDLKVKKEAIVIVITNPVEPATLWVHESLKGSCTVVGTGTSLDTFRMKFILSRHFNCSVDEVETMVIGEHGEHMLPLFSLTKIKGVNISELLQEAELISITEELKLSASTIRKTEKATKFGVAETCSFIIKGFAENKLDLPLSVPIQHQNASFLPKKDKIVLSWPVKWEDNILIPQIIDLNEEEMKHLIASHQSIQNSIMHPSIQD